MNKKCPWCNAENNITTYLILKDEFLTKEEFSIENCNECGLLFTWPRPEPNKIGRYYESEKYYSHSENKKGLIPRVYEAVKNINIKNKYKIATNKLEKGNILDIGCGAGDFLCLAKQRGWKINGVEPSEKARGIAERRLGTEIYKPEELATLPNKAFQCITMWHVLEHVDDLRNEIQQLKRLLARNGRLVIALPNYQSYDGQFYKEKWAAYDAPRHLNHFSINTIEKIMLSENLKLVDAKPLKWDAFYISYLSEQYKNKKMPFLRGIWVGLKSNFKARKSKLYSSMIYIFENNDV